MKKLFSFLIGGESLGLLSSYSSDAIFSCFFLTFFPATSDQRGVVVFGQEVVVVVVVEVVSPIRPVGEVVQVVVSWLG